MPRATFTTGYSRLSPPLARIVLASIVSACGLGIAVTFSPLANNNLTENECKTSDLELYRAEVDRIHAGEGYYQVLSSELTSRGYPTRSVFNWRTPLPLWLLGQLPSAEQGKILLGILSLMMMTMAFGAMAKEEEAGLAPTAQGPIALLRRHGTSMTCILLLVGTWLPMALGDFFFLPVLWAGVFIAISICAYGVDRPRLGVAFGLAAVFFRELALPYCVLCAGIAWWHGRRRELAAWTLGLAAWALFFGLHWQQVLEWMPSDSHAHRQSWFQFGGAGFIISAAQMNGYLLLLPQWVAALYLVAAMVGFAGWSTSLGTRIGLAVCLYLTAFSIVGQGFNYYWGFLLAQLLCFGAARFPASVRDLWQAANSTVPCRAFQ
jgi:hypothetical protein